MSGSFFTCILSSFRGLLDLGKQPDFVHGDIIKWWLHLEGNFSITKSGMGLDCIWAVAKVSCVEKVLSSFSLSGILMTGGTNKHCSGVGGVDLIPWIPCSRKRLYNIAAMKKESSS